MIKTYDRNGQIVDGAEAGLVVLSGSFNPLHDGHKNALRVAAGMVQRPGAYELSIDNCEKPSISPDEMLTRMEQFDGLRLILTDEALFVDKARLMPGTIFVMGYDTAERFLTVPSGSKDAELDEIRDNGCSFLVGGRRIGREFKTLKDLQHLIFKYHKEMFREITEDSFRNDISSTKIRETRLGYD